MKFIHEWCILFGHREFWEKGTFVFRTESCLQLQGFCVFIRCLQAFLVKGNSTDFNYETCVVSLFAHRKLLSRCILGIVGSSVLVPIVRISALPELIPVFPSTVLEPGLVLRFYELFVLLCTDKSMFVWCWKKNHECSDTLPSEGSRRRARRPCLELLWTNMLSDTASTWPSTLTVVDTTTCAHTQTAERHVHPSPLVNEPSATAQTLTWNLLMSRGFPAFFKQFWLHLRKNFRKNLEAEQDKDRAD